MKKFLSLLMTVLILLGLAGCGEAKKDVDQEKGEELYGDYVEYLSREYKNGNEDVPRYYYAYKNVDGVGNPELILKNGNKIEFFQYGRYEGEKVSPFSTYDFGEGEVRILNSGDDDYHGIIFNVNDSVVSDYGYMTIIDEHMQTEQLFKIKFVGDEKNEETITISDDEKLIELAREAMEEDRDVIFKPIA